MAGISKAEKRIKEGKIFGTVIRCEDIFEDEEWHHMELEIKWDKDGKVEEFWDYGSDIHIEEDLEKGDRVQLSIVGDYDAMFSWVG